MSESTKVMGKYGGKVLRTQTLKHLLSSAPALVHGHHRVSTAQSGLETTIRENGLRAVPCAPSLDPTWHPSLAPNFLPSSLAAPGAPGEMTQGSAVTRGLRASLATQGVACERAAFVAARPDPFIQKFIVLSIPTAATCPSAFSHDSGKDLAAGRL